MNEECTYSLTDNVPLVEGEQVLVSFLLFQLLFPLQREKGVSLRLTDHLILSLLSILVPREHDGFVLVDEVFRWTELSIAGLLPHNTVRILLNVL